MLAAMDKPIPSAPTLSSLHIDRQPAARGRRRWPWVAGAIAAAGIGLALLAPRQTEVQAGTVQSAYPTQQYSQLAASGYVVAQRRAAVSSKATGRLVELNVREGSVVKKGDLLARLDAADVSANLAVSIAAVRQSEAAAKQAESNLKLAQSQQANADDELKRALALAAQGFLSPQAVDTVQTRARSAAFPGSTATAKRRLASVYSCAQ